MDIAPKKGFTLTEVLISLLLLSIVLIGGMGFYFNSTDVMTTAMHKKIAMEIATQAMEQIKDAGYVSLPIPATGNWETATTVTFGDFKVQKQRRVTDELPGGATANKKVEIQVSWPESGKQTTSVINLVTYMAP